MNRKLKTKRIVAILLALTLVIAFAACGKSDAPAKDASAADAAADTTAALDLDRQLNVAIVGDACELHFIAADYLGLFEDAGIDVNWTLTGPGGNTQASIVAGDFDVTDGVLDSWLKPIEQGLDVKLTTALQQGCMSTVVLADSPYQTLADLKGKKIGGMGATGSGTANYLWRLLEKQGLNPLTDFEWLPFDAGAAYLALQSGEIEALAMPDTLIWPNVQSGEVRFISRLASDPELSAQTCCVLAFSPKFTDNYPEATKKVTAILYEASNWLGTDQQNFSDALKYGYDTGLINMGTYEASIGILEPYVWKGGVDLAESTFLSIFEDYQKFGFIDADVDVSKVVDKIFIHYDELDK
jgi:NitT/TauT family transport system substrate-binding protein